MQLKDDEVHLWQAWLSAARGQLQGYSKLLSEDELQRILVAQICIEPEFTSVGYKNSGHTIVDGSHHFVWLRGDKPRPLSRNNYPNNCIAVRQLLNDKLAFRKQCLLVIGQL